MKLLSEGKTNAKLIKSDKFGEYKSAILYLSPFTLGDGKTNLCHKSSEGCRKSCLFTSGRGKMQSVFKARTRKTVNYLTDKNKFLNQLADDIFKFIKKCNKLNKKPCVRLNGTTDIVWEKSGIIQLFPNVQFYDYTKIAKRLEKPLPKNYHLTFSLHENNLIEAKNIINNNLGNVAVVFGNKLPDYFMGRKVIDGDKHDLRFLDEKNVIVGLIAKGEAKKDISGFVK